jgi:tetratricopeptide (TPR) repeat protein
MNAKYQHYLRFYKEHIRDSFEGFFRMWDRNALLRAIDLYNADKYEEALRILESLRKRCKTTNEHCAVLTFTALCYDDLHYFASAVDCYREILKLDPERSEIHSNLGLLYRRRGEYENAIYCFNDALVSDPRNPYAFNNLALTHYRMGAYDEAIKNAERALSIKGNLYQAANCLALCYLVKGNKAAAKKYYQIAIHNGGDPKLLEREIEKLKEGHIIGDDDFWDL